jgi:hypothetical protein
MTLAMSMAEQDGSLAISLTRKQTSGKEMSSLISETSSAAFSGMSLPFVEKRPCIDSIVLPDAFFNVDTVTICDYSHKQAVFKFRTGRFFDTPPYPTRRRNTQTSPAQADNICEILIYARAIIAMEIGSNLYGYHHGYPSQHTPAAEPNAHPSLNGSTDSQQINVAAGQAQNQTSDNNQNPQANAQQGTANHNENAEQKQARPEGETKAADKSTAAREAEKQSNPNELSEEELRQVEELQKRDREVRQHEQAHLAAAGPHANGGPTYSYQSGPNGKRYAVGGEVSIDTSPVPNNPEATIQKAQTIQAAARAPAEPSAQDRAVAAQAAQMAAQARIEMNEQRAEERVEAKEQREQTNETEESETKSSAASEYEKTANNHQETEASKPLHIVA